jgi:hypothetical protein
VWTQRQGIGGKRTTNDCFYSVFHIVFPLHYRDFQNKFSIGKRALSKHAYDNRMNTYDGHRTYHCFQGTIVTIRDSSVKAGYDGVFSAPWHTMENRTADHEGSPASRQ